MPKLYTVDRRGTLREGMVLDLVRFTDISPRELQLHLDNMFPQGVSCHGNNYFLSNGSHGVVVSPMIELLFEYVRRACYPDRPSRFTSWFGVESVDDAKRFRERNGVNGAILRFRLTEYSERTWGCSESTGRFLLARSMLIATGKASLARRE